LVADVVVSKHADHLPLYRQSQILARYGVRIERTTLAQWVGAAAAEFQPLHDHLVGRLKASPRLFCDETRCPAAWASKESFRRSGPPRNGGVSY
jgi:transposase